MTKEVDKEVTFTKALKAKLEKQILPWRKVMNFLIGTLAFGLGISSLGTKSPLLWSSVSMVFIICMFFQAHELFPQVIKEL